MGNLAKRGPKKTPTKLLLARGSRLGTLRQSTELLLPLVAPDPPDFLSVEARAEWDRLVPVLIGNGILAAVDRGALACTCQAWGRYVEAERRLSIEGLTVTTLAGGTKPHPCVSISATAWSQYIKGCALFGIDPADRSNVTRAEPDELIQLEALIARLTLARKGGKL